VGRWAGRLGRAGKPRPGKWGRQSSPRGGEVGAGGPRGEGGQAPARSGRGVLGRLGQIKESIGKLILDYLAAESNELKRKLE
jgi:hypothetical protein